MKKEFLERRGEFLLPPKGDLDGMSRNLAGYLLRFGIPAIWILSAAAIVLSQVLVPPEMQPISFQRCGNLLILIGLAFALWSARKIQLIHRTRDWNYRLYYEIEKDKNPHFNEYQLWEIARLRVDRAMPALSDAVQRSLLPHEIAVVALGTLIAGYGDLLLIAIR